MLRNRTNPQSFDHKFPVHELQIPHYTCIPQKYVTYKICSNIHYDFQTKILFESTLFVTFFVGASPYITITTEWRVFSQSKCPKLPNLYTQSFKSVIKFNWINQLMITSKLSHNFPRSFSMYGITTRVFVYILAVKLLKKSVTAHTPHSWPDLYCKLSLSILFIKVKNSRLKRF